MANLKLDVAFWDYDRTRALADGTVKIHGVDAAFHSARIVTEIFEGMIRQRKFDVSELGMTYYLRTLDLDNPPSSHFLSFRTGPFAIPPSISTRPAVSKGRKTLRARRSVN